MDFEARRAIEALRSGIPSRHIGGYFTSARTEMLAGLSEWLDSAAGGGKIITGNYGEGKTHLLNTVFTMARNKNMAVSMISLSKETPFNQLHLVYQKIALNTYLPGREQPGFSYLLDTLGSLEMAELQLYAGKELQTDKLYYLLKAYCGTDNPEYKFILQADLCGDFIQNPALKKLYMDIIGDKIVFSANFAKTRHIEDYFHFLRRLFSLSGLGGWIILFDEAEHIGRLGRKSRFKAYSNISKFFRPGMKNIFTLFAMHESYSKEVIEGKNERLYLSQAEDVDKESAEEALSLIESAPELSPLRSDELMEVIGKILRFHAKAYDWQPGIDAEGLNALVRSRGFLLRTKIRAAIEILDQLYQYGDTGAITTGALDQERYTEEIPLPEDLPGM